MRDVSRGPVVIGVFRDRAHAQRALSNLRGMGFTAELIETTGTEGRETRRAAAHGPDVGQIAPLRAEPGDGGAGQRAGISEGAAQRYEREVKAGRVLVAVEASDRPGIAREALRRDGGIVEEEPDLNDPANITDTVQSTAERYPPMTQPIEAARSVPRPGIGPNLEGDLSEPVLPNDVSERGG